MLSAVMKRGITPVPRPTSIALTLLAKHPEDVEELEEAEPSAQRLKMA